MIAILLFLMFLDVKQVPIDDEMVKDFSVSELANETTTDCTEGGTAAVSSLARLTLEFNNPLPVSDDITEQNNVFSHDDGTSFHLVPLIDTVTIGSGDVKPSVSSKRDGTASSPEPPVAIVGMIVLLLLLLLYGRRPFKSRL